VCYFLGPISEQRPQEIAHVIYLAQHNYNSIIDICHFIYTVRITAHIASHLGSQMRVATFQRTLSLTMNFLVETCRFSLRFYCIVVLTEIYHCKLFHVC